MNTTATLRNAQEGPACRVRGGFRNHADADTTNGSLLAFF